MPFPAPTYPRRQKGLATAVQCEDITTHPPLPALTSTAGKTGDGTCIPLPSPVFPAVANVLTDTGIDDAPEDARSAWNTWRIVHTLAQRRHHDHTKADPTSTPVDPTSPPGHNFRTRPHSASSCLAALSHFGATFTTPSQHRPSRACGRESTPPVSSGSHVGDPPRPVTPAPSPTTHPVQYPLPLRARPASARHPGRPRQRIFTQAAVLHRLSEHSLPTSTRRPSIRTNPTRSPPHHQR